MRSAIVRGTARQKVRREPIQFIDIEGWLDQLFSDNKAPRLSVKLRKLAEIITFATANAAGISVDCQPVCWKRPRGKACRGLLRIQLALENDEIRWRCPACGNQGVTTGWRGEFWDMTSSSTNV
jgi:hypothetical protein